MTPIYVQIADAIENDIISEKLQEGDSCYSQIVIAKELKVNPATAAKGIRLLVDRGILDKQRGQAMIVASNAKKCIIERKKTDEFQKLVKELIMTAKKLGIEQKRIVESIQEVWEEL